MRGRASGGRSARRREGKRAGHARSAATERGGGEGLPVGDTGGGGRGGDRGRTDRDGERVGVGCCCVVSGRGGLGRGDRGGANGKACDHAGGGVDRGFARIAAGVADRAVAAAGEGRGRSIRSGGAHGD